MTQTVAVTNELVAAPDDIQAIDCPPEGPCASPDVRGVRHGYTAGRLVKAGRSPVLQI